MSRGSSSSGLVAVWSGRNDTDEGLTRRVRVRGEGCLSTKVLYLVYFSEEMSFERFLVGGSRIFNVSTKKQRNKQSNSIPELDNGSDLT